MWNFSLSAVINAIALWATVSFVPGIELVPFNGEPPYNVILSYVTVAAVYGLIHSTVGRVVKFLAIPFTIITLGLLTLFINGLLLWLTTVTTNWFGWGLSITEFWPAFWGALLMSILSALITWVLRLFRIKHREA